MKTHVTLKFIRDNEKLTFGEILYAGLFKASLGKLFERQ